MPTLWREDGFIFKFRMGDCDERPHVHVVGNGGFAKVWLRPVAVEKMRRYSGHAIGRVLTIAKERATEWLARWESDCRGE